MAQSSGSSGSSSTTGAAKMSDAQCQSMWTQADASGSGMLSKEQTSAMINDFGRADANQDGRLSNAEFKAACQAGLVKGSATTGAGSGTSGSGSSSGSTRGSGAGSGSSGSTGSSGSNSSGGASGSSGSGSSR